MSSCIVPALDNLTPTVWNSILAECGTMSDYAKLCLVEERPTETADDRLFMRCKMWHDEMYPKYVDAVSQRRESIRAIKAAHKAAHQHHVTRPVLGDDDVETRVPEKYRVTSLQKMIDDWMFTWYSLFSDAFNLDVSSPLLGEQLRIISVTQQFFPPLAMMRGEQAREILYGAEDYDAVQYSLTSGEPLPEKFGRNGTRPLSVKKCALFSKYLSDLCISLAKSDDHGNDEEPYVEIGKRKQTSMRVPTSLERRMLFPFLDYVCEKLSDWHMCAYNRLEEEYDDTVIGLSANTSSNNSDAAYQSVSALMQYSMLRNKAREYYAKYFSRIVQTLLRNGRSASIEYMVNEIAQRVKSPPYYRVGKNPALQSSSNSSLMSFSLNGAAGCECCKDTQDDESSCSSDGDKTEVEFLKVIGETIVKDLPLVDDDDASVTLLLLSRKCLRRKRQATAPAAKKPTASSTTTTTTKKFVASKPFIL